MLRPTIIITALIYVALIVLVSEECEFLRPVLGMIWQNYQRPILFFSALFWFNSGVVVYHILRRLTLADTGEKLAYIEKHLRGRSSISKELTERIREER